MRKRTFKFGMLALVALALTYCQREDAPEAPQQDPVPTVDPQAVVSLNEAKSLFEASENQKQTANATSRSSKLFIELAPYWENFFQGKTPLENVYASVPVTVVGTDVNAEVLFLKENGTTKQYLFVTDIDSLATDKQIINADYYLFDIKGYFISAFRMTNGLISHRLVPKKKGTYRWVYNLEKTQANKLYPFDPKDEKNYIRNIMMDGDPWGAIQLEPVTVYGHHNTYIPPIYFIPNYFVYPSYDREDRYRHKEFDTSGGGSNSYSGNSKKGSSDIGADLTKVKMDGGDNIINELENPCAKALVDKAPTLANDIATLLNNTFGTNDNINITFRNKSLGNTTDVAETDCKGTISSENRHTYHTLDCDVTLNDDVIKGASQEYILATIYHEVIHAYLNAESQILGQEVFNKKYPFVKQQYLSIGGEPVRRYVFLDRHERFAPFIESLARSIMSLPGTNISYETAIAMAKKGVVEESSLSQREKYLDSEQKLGKSGTTCTP